MYSGCGHMSISWFGQSLKLGLGLEYFSGRKMVFRCFPMYCVYRNSKVFVICASNMHEAFKIGFKVFFIVFSCWTPICRHM